MRHGTRLALALAGAALLCGCATEPPANRSVDNSRFFPTSQDVLWKQVLAVAGVRGMYVTSTDRVNGVITIEQHIVAPDRSGNVYDWAECGGVSLAERPVSQLADLKVLVQPAPGGARVTVDGRYSELRQTLDRQVHRVMCTSTGQLEYELMKSYALY